MRIFDPALILSTCFLRTITQAPYNIGVKGEAFVYEAKEVRTVLRAHDRLSNPNFEFSDALRIV